MRKAQSAKPHHWCQHGALLPPFPALPLSSTAMLQLTRHTARPTTTRTTRYHSPPLVAAARQSVPDPFAPKAQPHHDAQLPTRVAARVQQDLGTKQCYTFPCTRYLSLSATATRWVSVQGCRKKAQHREAKLLLYRLVASRMCARAEQRVDIAYS
jgi:hypothetical protein